MLGPMTNLRILTVLLLAAGVAGAQETKPAAPPARKAPPPEFAPVADDPKLPRVLLIGDSISIGYTLPVRKRLAGKANVHRIPANGGPTSNGVAEIDKWLAAGKWDVVHFNFGLHDIKILDGRHQVPAEQYEKNLREIVGKLKATGAALVWAETTPVPEGKLSPPRKPGDEVEFNRIAAKVMADNGVTVNPLHGFAKERLAEIQVPANVHFKPAGSEALGEKVAAAIEAALAARAK
jgi:acyl-CoA thioesterase-1